MRYHGTRFYRCDVPLELQEINKYYKEGDVKKVIGIGLGLILLSLLSVSCGVSQSEYDKVKSELEADREQIQALQSELAVKDAELKSAQSDLSTKDAELIAIQESMGRAKSKMEIINDLFVPAMKGDLDNMTKIEVFNFFLSWRDKINTMGDPMLASKFQAIIDSNGSDEATASFFVYLFESIPDTLE
jgi:hypothetical protein